MTPRQRDTLSAIEAHRHRHGIAPTLQEIADKLGISKVTVHEYTKALVAQGELRVTNGKWRSRSLEVVNPSPRRPLRFPIVGTIGERLVMK